MSDTASAPVTAPSPVKAPVAPAKVETAPATPSATPLEAKPVPTQDDKDIQRRAAAIARAKKEEARIQKAREAFTKDQEAYAKRNAEQADKARHLDELSRLAKTDPLKYLEAAGIDPGSLNLSNEHFEKLAKKVLKGDTRTPEEIAEALFNSKMKDYEARMAKMAKDREELDRRAQQKANDESIQAQINAAKAQISDLAKTDMDKYEFINSTPGAIDHVWDEILKYHTASGKVPKFEEALDAYETELEANFYERSKTSKKIQARLEKERLEAAAKEEQASAQKYDRYGKKITKDVITKEVTPEVPKKDPVLAEVRLSPKKDIGLNETIRQAVQRSKAAQDL